MIAYPLFPYFLEKRIVIPTSLVSFTSTVIGEYGSIPYIGLARAVPSTNTKFKLLTQARMPYTSKHRTSYFKSTLTFMGLESAFPQPDKNGKCLCFFIIIIIIINFKIFFSITSSEIPAYVFTLIISKTL